MGPPCVWRVISLQVFIVFVITLLAGNMRILLGVAIVILAAAAFYAGMNFSSSETLKNVSDSASLAALVSGIGFTPVNVSMRANSVLLFTECRLVQFEVTPDQAYAIMQVLTGTSTQRPLTHDIFKEALDNFGVQVVRINIDRYEQEIYKATVYFVRGSSVLGLDTRPSDAIALAVRYKATLYVEDGILQRQGTNIC